MIPTTIGMANSDMDLTVLQDDVFYDRGVSESMRRQNGQSERR